VTLRILRSRKLLPNRQKKAAVEAKLNRRHRANENLISLKSSFVRNCQKWDEASLSDGWEASSQVSDTDISETGLSVGSTELPECQLDKIQRLKKKHTYRKSIRCLRLTDSVEHVVRQMSSDGQWPAKVHFRKGAYSVGPSREELRLFQRKQSLFFEIRAILDQLVSLAFWFPVTGLLRELKSMVFKYLNTGTKGVVSVEQRSLLGDIRFLMGSHKSPSVNWKSSNRATQSVDIFGYTMWTNSPKTVLTRY
jgi:hypothetical protein